MKKTKKKAIFLLLAIFLLSFSACMKKDDESIVLRVESDNELDVASESIFSGLASIDEVMDMGESMLCEVDLGDDNFLKDSESFVYIDIKNERTRSETSGFANYGEGELKEVRQILVIKEGVSYSWDELSDEDGFIFNDFEDGDGDYLDDDYSDEKVNLKCKKWVVDSSKFKIPEDRDFIDLNDSIGDLMFLEEDYWLE